MTFVRTLYLGVLVFTPIIIININISVKIAVIQAMIKTVKNVSVLNRNL